MNRRDVRGRICEDPVCLNRYNTLVAQRELESQPNFMWCQNPQCGRGQVYQQGGASPIVICQYCQSAACFTHRVPWHNGMTCEDYDLVIQRIQASEDYIGAHTKQCPSCRRPIEKLSGCDHMTCHRPGGCGHEFCWICLADYGPIFQEGNNRHNSDCRYHPENRASDRSYSPEPHIIGVQIYPPGPPSITTDTTSGSESSGFERVEWPPAPMPLRLNNSWENRTSTRSTRPSYDNAWRPAAPPRHYLRVIQEESDRRTSHEQSINSRAQQTSYAESSRSSHDIVWQPSTPPTPYLRESQPQEELDRRRSRGQTINSQAQRTSYVESSRSSYDIVCRLVIPPTPRLQDDQLPDKLVRRTRDGQSINSPSYIYAGSSRPSSYVARQPASPPISHLQHNQLPEELDDRELEVQALYTWAWRQGRTASWWPPTPPLPPSPPLPRGEENRNEDKRHGRVWEDTLST
ncbi:unnamed protein product [Rhizoctonia solani]|uniref:RBR-type E3 ubiquitin transferase n=1 Tax=Rhizoctonia solani TaxID=456999 RepID=A0A8H3HRG8_9AGAM|nr:unnamed protein product [Rhizoctonia solani]